MTDGTPKGYKRYSPEFELAGVRLATLGEKPKAQVARELGIRVNQLRNWRLDFEEEERRERLSVRWLRRKTSRSCDVRTPQLKVENERLREAAIYFARGST